MLNRYLNQKRKAMISRFLLLFLLISSIAYPQKKTEEIVSKKLNETREITIVTPNLYETNKDKTYPLIVVLDGEYLVDPFAGILSYTAYWDDLPQAIIVGINQNKDNDQRYDDTQYDTETGVPLNKGNQFYEFITTELLPHMEKNYRVSPFKVIAGHNITAGYINFFLYKDDPVFNAYIAFSPEMAPEMETRVPQMAAELKKPVFYYLATADGDIKPIRDKINTLNEGMKAVTNPKVRYFFDDFTDATHYSLVTYAIPNALYSIFSSYQPITSKEYQEKIVTLPSGYVEYLEQRYEMIEKELGVKMPVRLNDFRAIEAAIMKNGAHEELKDLAKLARKNYPKTVIGEYYEALYFEATGNFSRAKKTYLNSYTLEDIGSYTKDYMLKKAESITVE